MRNVVNIVNFIRGVEPRYPELDLLKPVKEQIRLMKELNLPGTFLVQYDALIRKDVQELLLALDPAQFEIGLWLEMNQPHVQAAGLPWRGRRGYRWDWHAHCGFSVGYTPEEREKLVDVFFEKFEEVFGRPVKSVGSWMIDIHTIKYMADKYHIDASCNCKDQWGTDGYVVWGGYWNQGYYPSRYNVLCPAQTKENQVNVPILRMLGSDPVVQYDAGLSLDDGASECQTVATLEPADLTSGGKPEWIDWFVRQNFEGGSLAFAYAQTGQENSFGWGRMQKGIEYQFPLFAKMRNEGKVIVETMGDTGRWFKQNFELTPATAVSALEPYGDRQAQSVWYDSKDYRANVYVDKEGLRLRDLTLFDEMYKERYLTDVCTTDYLVYDNLLAMDGNRMSGKGIRAGVWFTDADGKALDVKKLSVLEDGTSLTVKYDGGSILLSEDGVKITGDACLHFRWNTEKTTFKTAEADGLYYEHNGMKYMLKVNKGNVTPGDMPVIAPVDGEIAFALKPLA